MLEIVTLTDELHQPPEEPIGYAVVLADELFVAANLIDAERVASAVNDDARIYPLWASAGHSLSDKRPRKWR